MADLPLRGAENGQNNYTDNFMAATLAQGVAPCPKTSLVAQCVRSCRTIAVPPTIALQEGTLDSFLSPGAFPRSRSVKCTHSFDALEANGFQRVPGTI